MTPYWLLFLVPVFGALVPLKLDFKARVLCLMIFAGSVIAFMGFRKEIGGDWIPYLTYLSGVSGLSLLDSIQNYSYQEPGFITLNWLSEKFGFGIVGMNLIGATVLLSGIISFCQKQPLPYLALAVAVPYLIIVVGIGYSRQAISLGIILFALTIWKQKKFLLYCGLILLAATFHRSAIIFLLFSVLMDRKTMVIRLVFIFPVVLIFTMFLALTSDLEAQVFAYLGGSFTSEGGFVRVLMNLIPAVIFFLYFSKFKQFGDQNLWLFAGLLNCILVITVYFPFTSSISDRIALYFLPIQIVVFSRIPTFIDDIYLRTLLVCGILSYYATVLFVWLNFSPYAQHWVPYRTFFDILNKPLP